MQSRQTRTTKNNTPSMKNFKRGQGLALGPRTQKARNYRKIWIISHKAMCLLNFNSKDVHRLFQRNTLFNN
jgi:hypothetical protein